MSLISFNELKSGHFVKICGKFRHTAGFIAVEITLESVYDDGEIECIIQEVDRRRKTLHVCDQEVFIPDGIEMKDEDGELVNSMGLKSGDMIKLKGVFTAGGFVPRKIKLRPAKEFNIEQVQGVIAQLDYERQTMSINGIHVLVTAKTVIEHGDSSEEFRDFAVPYIPI